MPKIFNIDFSSVTTVNSVSASTILNLENISYTDDNSSMVVVGAFKGFDTYRSMITRLLPDGTEDNTFNVKDGFFTNNDMNDSTNNAGSTLEINKIKIDSDGNYYVVGTFYQYRGATYNRIIKLFPNGDVDTSFNSGLGFGNTIISFSNGVKDLIILSSGKLLVGGQFDLYNGVPVRSIVRLNTDGSIDNTFNINNNNYGNIVSMSTDSNENIYYTKFFQVGKLLPNGDFDNTFIINNLNVFSGVGGDVNKVAVDQSDSIYVVGGFSTFSGISANRIVKLTSTGIKDNTFNYGSGFNNTVTNIIIDSFGKLYVRGFFSTYNGASNTVLIKLNSDGTKDTSFSNTSTLSSNNASGLGALKLDQNNKLLFGGTLTTYISPTFVNAPIRINTNGSLDTTFSIYGNVSGGNQIINDIEIDSNNNIIICGRFNSYKQPSCIYSLKTYNGKTNNNFNPNYGINVSASLTVLSARSIVKSQNNNLYIGGYFENYTLTNSNYRSIALLGLDISGNPNNTISVNTGANNTITNIFKDKLGGIFLTGSFSTYKGVGVPRLVKINSDASIDNSFNRSNLQSVNSCVMDFDSSNNIYLGGGFTTFAGLPNNYIIKLLPNGSKDTSFDNSIGFNSSVSSVFVDSYGKILVGGFFTTYKGNVENRIIRLNPDGSKDNTFDNSIGFNNVVRTIIMYDNKLYLGGDFTTYKNETFNSFIRLNYDGSIDRTFKIKSGLSSGYVSSLKVDDFGNLYVMGNNLNYQNYGQAAIVKIKPDGSRDPMFYVYSNNFRKLNYTNSFTSRIDGLEFI
jgi:uncharacterized delta-60 repeat protein